MEKAASRIKGSLPGIEINIDYKINIFIFYV
jgi:hypothetical protein